ncbi:MAG: hypothetical protein ACREPM_14575, partial [Gemmatimonadaceae bacterium]
MLARRSSIGRSLVHGLSLALLLVAALDPRRLAAQTKSMTVTGVVGLNWDSFDQNTGSAVISVQFTVRNTWTQAAFVWVEQDCGEWCGDVAPWSGTWTYLSPGQSTVVPVWLNVPEFGGASTGLVHLTVIGRLSGANLGSSDYAAAFVNLSAGTATLIAPARPSDVTAAPNGTTLALPGGWSSFNFIVTNNAGSPYSGASVVLSLRCGGFIGSTIDPEPGGGSCGKYAQSGNAIYNEQTPIGAAIQPGHPDTLPITLYGNNSARGYIRLIKAMSDPVTNTVVTDTASVLVITGDQLMPQVTPKAAPANVAPRIARADSFTVKNTGTVSASYAMSADCGTFAVGGCVANPSLVTIGPAATARIGVAYTPSATNGAMTTLRLVAVGSAAGLNPQTDTGSIVVTAYDAVPPTIVITPPEGTIATRAVTATVNVCDDGLVGNPVVTFNGVPLPDMFLRAAQSGCVTAGTSTFALTAQAGVNTLAVTDDDGYHTASSTRTFSYDDATEVAPQVAAVLAATKVVPGAAWADTFTVRNPGPVSAQYTITASCGAFGACT